MPAPDFHVVCGYADTPDKSANQPLFRDPTWSETGGASGTTTNAAPSGQRPVFMIDVAVDSYVSVAKAPNAANSPRYLIKADRCPYYVYGQPGDRLAWAAA